MPARPFPAARNIRLYYAFTFLMNSGLWLGIWIKYLLDERGLELRWILAMDLPFWLLVAALQAPTGALADHIGRKPVLAASALIYAFTILGFGLTTNYWMLFGDYMLWAFAQSMMSGADQALIFDSLKVRGEEQRFQHTIGRNFAIQLVATLLGVTAGGIVAQWVSLAFTVQVSALFPLAAMIAALLLTEAPIERTERHYLRNMQAGIGFSWRQPQVRYTLLIGAVLLTGTFGPVILVQPFLIEHNVQTALFGVFQAPVRLVSVGAALGAGYVGLRVARAPLFTVACAVIIAAYLGLALVDTTAAFGFFVAPAVVQAVTNPAVSAHLNERIPSEMRATVLSLMQLAFSLQVAFFEPALGFFADGVALRWAFLFSVGYFGVIMPPLLFLWRRAHPHGLRPELLVVAKPASG